MSASGCDLKSNPVCLHHYRWQVGLYGSALSGMSDVEGGLQRLQCRPPCSVWKSDLPVLAVLQMKGRCKGSNLCGN